MNELFVEGAAVSAEPRLMLALAASRAAGDRPVADRVRLSLLSLAMFRSDEGVRARISGAVADPEGTEPEPLFAVFHESWGDIHLGPDNALVAHDMLGGGTLLPVHWGTFDLALHAWDDPAERLTLRAGELGVHVVSDGGTRPHRVHVRDPSFTNLQATAAMCEGGMLSDAIAAVASIDPVMGGVDR